MRKCNRCGKNICDECQFKPFPETRQVLKKGICGSCEANICKNCLTQGKSKNE